MSSSVSFIITYPTHPTPHPSRLMYPALAPLSTPRPPPNSNAVPVSSAPRPRAASPHLSPPRKGTSLLAFLSLPLKRTKTAQSSRRPRPHPNPPFPPLSAAPTPTPNHATVVRLSPLLTPLTHPSPKSMANSVERLGPELEAQSASSRVSPRTAA